ncbi:hypothetical protein Pyn_04971 [Prunus yedoensis var. nudiflora]|uniref:Uncharacterized protein n=1 Tax=Prunus yedoensis var. nudiflora TaxID=2094558 RepID=A0A314UIN1_PRUYE|nr:hypothetical protein Pyn_04971 [Prunus yedoensis var. nudiflora]
MEAAGVVVMEGSLEGMMSGEAAGGVAVIVVVTAVVAAVASATIAAELGIWLGSVFRAAAVLEDLAVVVEDTLAVEAAVAVGVIIAERKGIWQGNVLMIRSENLGHVLLGGLALDVGV